MITIKSNKEQISRLEKDFSSYITTRNVGYILFTIKTPDNIITVYNNQKNDTFKVTIQGQNYSNIIDKYFNKDLIIKQKIKKTKESLKFIDIDLQIGSDEVGTGDFLGPIVVCSSFCDNETIELIKKYGIEDSKKLNDKKIIENIPLILNKIKYEIKILPNENYNNAILKGYNANRIKSILHNFVLAKLYKKYPQAKNIYVDQFCSENQYYEYLKGSKYILKNIIFKEKGETYYPSVALASCVARYFFLKEIDSLSKKYGMEFPLGAGKAVDEFSIKFIKKFGFDEFKKISKNNFRNFQDLKELHLF